LGEFYGLGQQVLHSWRESIAKYPIQPQKLAVPSQRRFNVFLHGRGMGEGASSLGRIITVHLGMLRGHIS
jgi:hypothetical protein